MFKAGGFTTMLACQPHKLAGCYPQDVSLCAALQAIIAYADGQENSSISVTSAEGRIVLSGEVETLAALERAVIIAECFASRPIIADLAIRQRVCNDTDRSTRRIHFATTTGMTDNEENHSRNHNCHPCGHAFRIRGNKA
ncbi:osmotically-inducible protein OsmY [Rhizobium sp. BIGb0125]|jgi:osmotically-inducible protein OsmY|uniref:BON domain-containing protein n=1 Tax=Rhizobium/Agrobacterium group TaxID=227290 RepID=UPI00216747EA|nr:MULTISPECIES: BON domain-containing protein [Rhizobium/Agrobacterium group]MCS4245649.1 osmotically-inducible protein OsmY [Rhizobium sp. BIGb0125]MDO5898181.1 BON domain-containing protein [Agrobacterium sp. Azo12]